MLLKLRMPAQKSWRKLSGTNRLPEVILDWLLQEFDERGATAVIPPKTNRKIQRNYDAEVYKWRHLVENYFAKIKEFRGIATRYDKTDCSYAACWNLVAALIASR